MSTIHKVKQDPMQGAEELYRDRLPKGKQRREEMTWYGRTYVCIVEFPQETECLAVNVESGTMVHCAALSSLVSQVRGAMAQGHLRHVVCEVPEDDPFGGDERVQLVPMEVSDQEEFMRLLHM